MYAYFHWIALRAQFTSAILEIAHQFLLFCIDGDDWFLPAQTPLHFAIEMFELGIAIRRIGPFLGLAVGLSAISQLVQQFRHYLMAHNIIHSFQLGRQVANALACPPQWTFGI